MTPDDYENVRRLEAAGFKVIYEQPAQQCDDCGKIEELRPYGPKGQAVCFDCGLKDPEAMIRGAKKALGL